MLFKHLDSVVKEEHKILLHYAATEGNLDAVRYFTSIGVPVNNRLSNKLLNLDLPSDAHHLDYLKSLPSGDSRIRGLEDKTATALHRAVVSNNLDIIKHLLQEGAEVNAAMEGGETPLLIAVTFGYISVVKLLIRYGANVNVCTKWGYTAVHYAAQEGVWEILDLLLGNGADVNARTSKGQTSLHLACRNDDESTIYLLVEYGADTEIKDNDGFAPLHIAAVKGDPFIALLLLGRKADRDIRNNAGLAPVHYAALEGNIAVMKVILNLGGNRNSVIRRPPGFVDAWQRNAALTSTSIPEDNIRKFGVSIDTVTNCWNTLMQKVFKRTTEGSLNSEKSLRTTEVPANTRVPDKLLKLELLYNAGPPNLMSLMKDLVQEGPKANNDIEGGETPLILAAILGDFEMVKFLVEYGADVNVRAESGKTALHYAAEECCWEIFEFLLNNGTGVNTSTPQGKTGSEVTANPDAEQLNATLTSNNVPEDNARKFGINSMIVRNCWNAVIRRIVGE